MKRRHLRPAQCAIKGYKKVTEPTQDVKDLKFLIDQWREPEMCPVRSDLVVPDSSNRMHTGLSVDHVHYLATCMMKDGFRARLPRPNPHPGCRVNHKPTTHTLTPHTQTGVTGSAGR